MKFGYWSQVSTLLSPGVDNSISKIWILILWLQLHFLDPSLWLLTSGVDTYCQNIFLWILCLFDIDTLQDLRDFLPMDACDLHWLCSIETYDFHLLFKTLNGFNQCSFQFQRCRHLLKGCRHFLSRECFAVFFDQILVLERDAHGLHT